MHRVDHSLMNEARANDADHLGAIKLQERTREGDKSGQNSESNRFAPPFDERIYTVNEVARVLRISPNQTRTIFRNEPGVHDLSDNFGKKLRSRRNSQLRIPHSVLMRFWKRTEIR
jgi:hypothetical protein